jgi:hypothetical protein
LTGCSENNTCASEDSFLFFGLFDKGTIELVFRKFSYIHQLTREHKPPAFLKFG